MIMGRGRVSVCRERVEGYWEEVKESKAVERRERMMGTGTVWTVWRGV